MNENEMMNSVKRFLGIDDAQQDELLQDIIKESKQRILDFINADGETHLKALPEDIDYILRDVTIKRFNRISNEGATSDSEEGRSTSWESGYLAEYETQLLRYRRRKGRGITRFL